MSFVHLHLHTQYSPLDGAIHVNRLMPYIKKLGMNAAAITDHGTMGGVVHFYKEAKKHGIKPIIGCEVYVSSKSRFDRKRRKAHHLVLLAKNNEGYKNLCYLVSMGYKEGFYYKPRIDKALLAQHSKGLIGLSGCLGGSINSKILSKGELAAIDRARSLSQCFEQGCFYLEVQSNEYKRQTICNTALVNISRITGLPLVATCDCHYLKQKHHEAHEILMCMNTKKTLEEYRAKGLHSKELYVRSPKEMEKLFAFAPGAVENTQIIADQCNVELDLGNIYLPVFSTPNNISQRNYLRELATKGLKDRIHNLKYIIDRGEYFSRLSYELDVLISKDYQGYFLIVWDFINYARKNKIPVGPGRGSGAGSIVAWSLGITDLDPIYHELLFERFLNPERPSMVDFDIDFCPERRDEVIKYVSDKYGADSVAQISTFSSLSAKSVIKDVAKVLGVSFHDANEVTKLIPGLVKGKPCTIDKAIKLDEKLAKLEKDDARFSKIFEIGRTLEGLNRQTGVHAAGVVIGDKPIWDYVPTCKGKEDQLVTQFAKNEVEDSGLVKFDFLGLKTLTVIDNAEKLIRVTNNDFDVTDLDLKDPGVYELFQKGDTYGVFQFESSGMKKMLKELKPTEFNDLVAAAALFRPGPMASGMLDAYIDRKNGKQEVVYPHEKCEPVLKPTYGVIAYQEQVMRIAVDLCGFTLGRSDILRKAMGKKIPEVMAEIKTEFVDGAFSHSGMPVDDAEYFFDQIAQFAGYAFNKSHSAAYALIGYHTAYMKAHYPVEFMAALMSTEISSQDEIVKYVGNCRTLGIKIDPPNIQYSNMEFTVSDGKIIYGLGAIRGIGASVVDAIVDARKDGPFKSIYDLCYRVNLGPSALALLIKSGAMDCFGRSRSQLLSVIKDVIDACKKRQKDQETGQIGLFNKVDWSLDECYPIVEDLPGNELLEMERYALGFYLSGHPLDNYTEYIDQYTSFTFQNMKPTKHATMAVCSHYYKEYPYKSGNGWLAVMELGDQYGKFNAIAFDSTVQRCRDKLQSKVPLLVSGQVKKETKDGVEQLKFFVNTVGLLSEYIDN